jgi:hypothetical protein
MAGLLALQGAAPITLTALALGRSAVGAAHLLAEAGPAGLAAGTGRLALAEAARWASRRGLAAAATTLAATGGAGAAEGLACAGVAGALRAWSRPLDALGLHRPAPPLALAAGSAGAAGAADAAGRRPADWAPRRRAWRRRRWG